MTLEQELCLPLVETKIDPKVWTTQGKVGRGIRANPLGYLKDLIPFLIRNSMPLSQRQGRDYKSSYQPEGQGLGKPCTSPFWVSRSPVENGGLFETSDSYAYSSCGS